MTKRSLLATLLALSSAAAATAAPDVSFFGRTLQPLLDVESAESFNFGASYTKRQVYIFTDGTVLVAQVGEESVDHSPLPSGSAVASGKASHASLIALSAALAAAQVGQRRDCRIDPPDASQESYFRFTWFGAGKRKNTFLATEDPGPPDCPPQVDGLIDALRGVLNSTFNSATTLLPGS